MKFFIERGKQVASLVEAVTGSIKAVAAGSVDQAAKMVESALGRSIPVLIGFLSSVAGLGNLASKVQGIFQKMKKPLDKAVDWLIQKAKDLVLKLGKKLGLEKNKTKSQKPSKEQDENSSVKEKKQRLQKAVSETYSFFKESSDFEEVTQKLPLIKEKYQLKNLELVRDKKYKYRVKASINPVLEGPPGVLFTDDDLRELEAVATRYAKQIRDKGHKAIFLEDPKKYLVGDPTKEKQPKVKIGDTVEAAGISGIEDLAAKEGCTVLKTVEMKLVKNSGEDIRTQIPEIDFLILSDSQVKKIVSAKMKPKQFKAKQDRSLLRHFLEIPLAPPDVVSYVKAHFGQNRAYEDIDHVDVLYTQGKTRQRSSLSDFRSKHLSKVLVDTIEVVPLTPSPESDHGIQLRATEVELIDKTIELVKKHL